jgi:outer membrane protein OmpA-like peptidoglycan-associated protein
MSTQRIARRAKAGAALRIAALALAVSGSAWAQVDAERFEPAATHDGFVNAESSAVRDTDDRFEFGAYLNYQRNPLVITDADGELTRTIVSGRAGLDLVGSATLVGPLSLGLALPVHFAQSGDANPNGGGLGDLRIVPKLRLLDDRNGFGLALAVDVRAPTSTADYTGADGVTVFPKVIADHLFSSGFRFGVNAGVLIRETQTLANLEAGSEFAYAAALGYRIGGRTGKTELGVELVGAVGLKQADREHLPLEGFLYGRHALSREWQVLGGPALGLLSGYGVPTVRGFVGVRYAPTSHDRDGDGVGDSHDACPDVPEDIDGHDDADGCPEEDPDRDQDGVPDSEDVCPNEPETINGVDDEDGCPDQGKATVIYEDGEFQVLEPVQFEHGSSRVTPESKKTLNQVALLIKANPELERVRIEGHTDQTGPDTVNERLSHSRAREVRRYLIERGVAPQRLEAVGRGSSKPLSTEDTPRGHAKNRRVEFVVP